MTQTYLFETESPPSQWDPATGSRVNDVGTGQFLLGLLARESGVLANWLAVVGAIGGAAGLLTLAGFYLRTPLLIVVQIACFAVWGFATGFFLLREPLPHAILKIGGLLDSTGIGCPSGVARFSSH